MLDPATLHTRLREVNMVRSALLKEGRRTDKCGWPNSGYG